MTVAVDERRRPTVPASRCDRANSTICGTGSPGPGGPTSCRAPSGPTASRSPTSSELVDHWRTGYDWRAQEARINEHPQFTTTIDGQNVHFLHVRSPEPDALPLIATHGWPMSVVEYLDLIEPLTDPPATVATPPRRSTGRAVPCPVSAFSGPDDQPGWDTHRVARAWAELMDRLGYDRYGAHGNDSGSMISPEVGRFAPDRVVGVHVTQLFSFPSGDPSEFEDLTERTWRPSKFLEDFTAGGGLAYNQYQSAQPQTLGYALQDSPSGWVAWVAQLFRDWTDRDYVLTNASAYWLTGTIGSSIRLLRGRPHADQPTGPTTVPTGVAVFAEDFQTIRKLADRDHANIVQCRRHDRGSHFAPKDAPDLLLADIRDFFGDLR